MMVSFTDDHPDKTSRLWSFKIAFSAVQDRCRMDA